MISDYSSAEETNFTAQIFGSLAIGNRKFILLMLLRICTVLASDTNFLLENKVSKIFISKMKRDLRHSIMHEECIQKYGLQIL